MINIYSLSEDNVLTLGDVISAPTSGRCRVYLEKDGIWFQMKDFDTPENELFRELVPVSPQIMLLLQIRAKEIKQTGSWAKRVENKEKKDREELDDPDCYR
jgi:hypothetical protein